MNRSFFMRNKLIIIVISLMMLITSCAFPSGRNYVSTEITYSEPAEKYAFRLDMDSAETENAKYFFEPSIDNKEREECIKTTEKILSTQASIDIIPEIYIFSQNRYDFKYIKDHKFYSCIQDWRSADYIKDILITIYGNSAHYGILFGYANYLAKSYKWESIKGKFSDPSLKSVLDLNYLCFDDTFVTQNDVTIAKAVACDFVDSYLKHYKEEELQGLLFSYSEAINALSSYYSDNEVSYIPSSVQYCYGGKSYDYLVYSDYGTFYIANDWADLNAERNPLLYDGFLHSNYADIKTFFEINIEQMRQYRELFDLDDYNDDLDIVLAKNIASSNSFYHGTKHCIYLYNVDSLMHEYIHSLTIKAENKPLWQVEGFARYFSYYYDHYGIAFLNYDYNNSPDTEATKYVHDYLASIDRPIDMEKDFRELENLAVYSYGLTDPNKSYLTGSSFVQYLVNQYGESAVIDYIYGSGEPLPKTYSELVRDWIEYIENNYKDYT